ncbi:MAG: hypothetical protein ACI8X5_001387 [Planctomycetota bacterium]|jgi:hypothetical protein
MNLQRTLAHLLCFAGLTTNATAASTFGKDIWTQAELEAVTAEIQKEVAELRGEPFMKPVTVKLMDKPGLVKYLIGLMNEDNGVERIANEEVMFKMLGLLPPSVDYLQVSLDLLESQIGGFYDPSSKVFYLMESYTGGIAKVVLSHELTHALDDQYYDLDRQLKLTMDDRDSAIAYKSVVEGSGSLLMQLWMMGHPNALTPEEMRAMATSEAASMKGIPACIWKPLVGSYSVGLTFLNEGYRMRKNKSKTMADITRTAFEAPPITSEMVLHPSKYWKTDERDDGILVELKARALPEGWRLIEGSTFGEMHLALMTEEQKPVDFSNPMSLMSVTYTNEAAAGWGGDRMALYGNGDARYLTMVTYWDSKQDTQEFEASMQARQDKWQASVAQMDKAGVGANVVITTDIAKHQVILKVWYGVSSDLAAAITKAQVIETTVLAPLER